MTFLLIVLIVTALCLYGLKEYYQVKLGTKPQTASLTAITALADVLERLNPNGGRFLDLGSGYGGLILNLAKRVPQWDYTGIEQSPTPWLISNFRSFGKNFRNYRFFLADAMTWPLKSYDVVFAYQDNAVLKRWENSLARRLPIGVVLICLNHKLPRARIAQTVTIDQKTVFYIYQRMPMASAPPTAAQVAETAPA
jgi:SAM-dependent methyltransferase